MSIGKTSTTERDGRDVLLADPRFELLPFESFYDQLEHLPDGARIAITSSPQKGVDETVEMAEYVTERGYEAVPHLAARAVRDEDHFEEIAERLLDAGVTDVFVPGGDNDEAGEFESAYELLTTMDELGYEFEEVGITGYPEGHHFLDDETIVEAMDKKRPYATYIVTQICYDPDKVVAWVEQLRDRGVELPVDVGIPGVMKYQRLLGISRKVGVGDSMKFLRKTTGILGFVRQLIGSRGNYTPDPLIDGLAPYATDPEYDIKGTHLYTFNQVPDTEEWRKEALKQ